MRAKLSLLTVLVTGMTGCASSGVRLDGSGPHPIFYPTEMFVRSGPLQAKAEADVCIEKARSSGINPEDKSAGSSSPVVSGALMGAVAGSVGSALGGRTLTDVVKATAIGTAAGAAAGGAQAVFIKDPPEEIFRAFVKRCMFDKGYEIIGWK